MDDPRPLATILDDELLRRLTELLHESRRTESEVVAHIGEVEERRLYARAAAPSMFAYCTQILHLSEAEAYLRITVARAARQHPLLLAMLADGRLHLSAIARLARHLTRENREALLKRATHRSRRQIQELIAEISPRPDAPSLMRRLPRVRREPLLPPLDAPSAPSRAEILELVQAGVGTGEAQRNAVSPKTEVSAEYSGLGPFGTAARLVASCEPGSATRGRELCPDRVDQAGAPGLSEPPRAVSPELGRLPSRSVVEPLAFSRYKVQFTASAELHDKLERLRALLRSDVPDGDLGAVIDRAVTETLERLEARRYARTRAARKLPSPGASRPDKSSRTASASGLPRHIPATLRRAVHEREGRCRYVDEAGRRCSERNLLEYHHRHPFGMGGGHTLENVRLMCRIHNLYLAEHDYGRKAMAEHRRGAQRVPEDVCAGDSALKGALDP